MLVQDMFEIENGILTAYLGQDADIQIPEGVHTIGNGVFKGKSWMLSVQLPSTLKKIGAHAFKGCRKIKKIVFPEGLEEIGEYAFHRCHDLKEMIFPKSMISVGSHAFLYCDGLKKVVLEGPEHLGTAVFSHNMSLEEISLNKNLDDSNFAEEVFEGCVCLRKISLSGEVFEVSNLIEAMDSRSEYPKIIKSIARSVFHSLQIEDGVLQNFSINLKAISLPEGISAIGKACFFDKKGIVSIIFPETLKEIRSNAFLNCINLEEITIKNEKLLLDGKAFRGCCNLKKVNLSGKTYLLEDETDNELVGRIREQVLGDFYISGKVLVRYLGDEEQVQIPKEVDIIGEGCFRGNERLKVVTCPDNLKEIREQAFLGCVTLQTIMLSGKLKRIEREAFAECKKLLKCNLPDSLEYIGEYAFRRCFVLPLFDPWPKNAAIHPYAFYRAGNFDSINGKTMNAFSEEDKKAEKYIVGGLYTAEGMYTDGRKCTDDGILTDDGTLTNDGKLTADGMLTDGGKTLVINDIKIIGDYAFAASPDLEKIVIEAPECVIGRKAFSNCPRLRKVCLRVKELGKGVFSYCRNLEEVCMSGVSVLPPESFAGCYSLKKFEAKELTRMEARCFDECIHLNTFDFSGIKIIGERAFERCDSLKCVELHQVECGYHAFADCASLESVEISEDTVLKSGVFIGCAQIKQVVFKRKIYNEKNVENLEGNNVGLGEDNEKSGSVEFVDQTKGEMYRFSGFSDGLNHVGNTRPSSVREIISSIYSCFDIRDRRKLVGYSQDASTITIPDDIEELGQDVFRDHIRLKEINIPESVKIFGSHAFSQTAWLDGKREKSEMVIVNNVLLDGASCKGKVRIPISVKRLASWCFAGNIDITELEIPSESIVVEALSFRNCLNLKKITDWEGKEYALSKVSDLMTMDYPELVQKIFSECINCFKLDADGNLVESTGNITKLTFPTGIRSVGDGVYKDCHLLESISLSDDTISIGKSSFENSKWLKKVLNARSVKSIGALAFSGCQSLECIELSDELTDLGNRCFEHCSSLKEIYLSKGLERIPERAFFRCKSLRKIIIPESVKVIEPEAFAFCDNLEEVYISEDTIVSERAFVFCVRLQIYRNIGEI